MGGAHFLNWVVNALRTLVWLAIGFSAACVLGVYVLPSEWLLSFGILCFAAILITLCVKSRKSSVIRVLLFGCLAGMVWLGLFHSFYLRSALSADGQVKTLKVELSDYTYSSVYGSAAEGWIQLDEKPYRVKVYLSDSVSLKPGDIVEGNFLMRYTANGGAHLPTFHQGKGVFLLGYPRGTASYTKAEEEPLKYFPARLANSISQLIQDSFPDDTYPFALALLLGDDNQLDYGTDKALQISGIRHIIAVSGLHVSILFGLVYTSFGKNRVLTAAFGIPVLILFAAVAGFTPSIVRACVMQCLMILALLLNKEYDPPSALAFAVIVLLAVNPLTITSVSFQLSVAGITGIFLYMQPIKEILQKYLPDSGSKGFLPSIKRWCVNATSVTLSAMIFTTPLCAYYFGFISTYGVLTNLLTIWVISFVFYGIMLACLLGMIWFPLGQAIGWVMSWPIRYVLMISNLISKLPMAALYTQSVYIVAWLAFCYVLFVVFMRNKRKYPAIFAGCLAVGLVVAILCTGFDKPHEGLSVTVMDVGQGQCVLLQSNEEAFLVDCGNTQGEQAADVALRELWTRGIFSLDGVILTHYDKDHAGGVNALLSRVSTAALYLPDVAEENELRQQIVDANGEVLTWVQQTNVLELDNGKLTIFPSYITDDANESSLCVLFQVENYDILITGDRSIEGEAELLQMVSLPQLELLVAGHHGSASSTGLDLLQQTQPLTVAISVGEDNSYGHPSEETLERLRLFGCNVLRTDQQGTITFRG